VLDFDDTLDLDDVLKIRIQLDEQEAKLDYLRDKIAELESAENVLIQQEEKISSLISEVIDSKENVVTNPSKAGLSKARALLLRICDLEERLLCSEVEVGQLKNSISMVEMEAIAQEEQYGHVFERFDYDSQQSEDDGDDGGDEDDEEYYEDDDDYGDYDDDDEADEDSTVESYTVGSESTFEYTRSTFQYTNPQPPRQQM
jgi:sugar-specific transcriptional regulator TrmB